MKRLCLLLALIFAFGCAVPAYAYDIEEEPVPDDPVEPYSYTDRTNEVLTVENDIASVIAQYYGYSGLTTGATIEITIQKRFMLFWWNDVDGGHWIDTVSSSSGSVSHSLPVSSGTYRAVIRYKIYGSGGGYDEITQTVYQ